MEKKSGVDTKETIKYKAYFEKDGKLYLEILTTDELYKYAYLDDTGDVKLTDSLDDVFPVELPKTKQGDLAFIVKMPDENITKVTLFSPPELLEKIKAHIQKYCDLKELDIELCSYYVLFSWFYPKVNTVGYLRFLSDTGKGKSRILTVVSSISFYPISAGGSSSFSGIMRTKEHWHGTLVIDEADVKGDKENQVVKYLNLGFEANKHFILSDKQNPKKQEVFDPFGPKIIAMREPFRDNATEGRLLSLSPHENTNEGIPILLPKAFDEEAAQLRNEIARFVLARWQDVDGEKMISFRGMGIEPRLQQLAMPLSIIFQLWDDGNERFKAYLIDRQRALKRARAQSWHGSIFNLVLDFAKGNERVADFQRYYDSNGELQAVTPSMIATAMNTTPKNVTATLRSIGFESEFRYVKLTILPDEGSTKRKERVRAYVVPDERTWREIVQRYYHDDSEDGTDGTLHRTRTTNDKSGTDRTDTLTHNENMKIPEVLKARRYLENDTGVLSSVPSVPNDEDEERTVVNQVQQSLNDLGIVSS